LPVGEPSEYSLTITHDGAVSASGVYTLPASTATNVTLTDNFKALGLSLAPNSVVISHDVTGLEHGVTFDTNVTVTWVQPAISIRKLVEDKVGSGNYIEADATDGLTGIYFEGQPVNYRFIVKNTGSMTLSSVTLSDDLAGFLCNQNVV